jgi:hypothetical protein
MESLIVLEKNHPNVFQKPGGSSNSVTSFSPIIWNFCSILITSINTYLDHSTDKSIIQDFPQNQYKIYNIIHDVGYIVLQYKIYHNLNVWGRKHMWPHSQIPIPNLSSQSLNERKITFFQPKTHLHEYRFLCDHWLFIKWLLFDTLLFQGKSSLRYSILPSLTKVVQQALTELLAVSTAHHPSLEVRYMYRNKTGYFQITLENGQSMH